MLFQKKIIRILSAVVLIALLWIVFFIVQGLFVRTVSHHEVYIPSHSTSVLKVENETLIRTFLEDVVLPDGLEAKYRSYLRSPSDEEGTSYGIDALSTLYVFTFREKNCQLLGVLVNLTDEEQFNEAFNEDPQPGVGHASKEGAGLILLDNNSAPLTAEQLSKTARKLLEKPSTFDLKKLDQQDSPITFWKNEYVLNNGTRSFKNIHLALFLEQENLTINGYADYAYPKARNYPILKPQDLSIQSQFVPNGINEIWTNSMKKVGINFPRITYVSGNYHYAEPSPVKAFKVLPHFDGIYGFEKNMQIRVPLVALAASGDIQALNLKSFEFGGKTFYYEQIDSRTIYLGQSPYSLASNQGNTLLKIEGNMNQLLEMRNGGMLARFLSMSPEYNAAERFLSGIDFSEFNIEQDKDDKANLTGKIRFKKDKNALNETLLLLINLGLFE